MSNARRAPQLCDRYGAVDHSSWSCGSAMNSFRFISGCLSEDMQPAGTPPRRGALDDPIRRSGLLMRRFINHSARYAPGSLLNEDPDHDYEDEIKIRVAYKIHKRRQVARWSGGGGRPSVRPGRHRKENKEVTARKIGLFG